MCDVANGILFQTSCWKTRKPTLLRSLNHHKFRCTPPPQTPGLSRSTPFPPLALRLQLLSLHFGQITAHFRLRASHLLQSWAIPSASTDRSLVLSFTPKILQARAIQMKLPTTAVMGPHLANLYPTPRHVQNAPAFPGSLLGRPPEPPALTLGSRMLRTSLLQPILVSMPAHPPTA